jgi:small-conductance mechanosensitive channel
LLFIFIVVVVVLLLVIVDGIVIIVILLVMMIIIIYVVTLIIVTFTSYIINYYYYYICPVETSTPFPVMCQPDQKWRNLWGFHTETSTARLVVEDEHHIAPNFQRPGTSEGFFG